jgi:hypothetical protein
LWAGVARHSTLVTPAHKRATPLQRQATQLLTDLVRSLPQGNAAHSQPG